MRTNPLGRCLVVSCVLACLALSAPGAALFQTDDFQDGTTASWTTGSPDPNPPFNASDSGPLGVGDNALVMQANGGSGPGSRLLIFNTAQWTGDYVGAGITAITADVYNPNNFDLVMRLALESSLGAYSSTLGIILGPGSGWQNVTFGLGANDLTQVAGSADWSTVLGGVTALRILHNTSPGTRGLAVEGGLLLDNITAVPEPTALGLAGLGLVLWVWRIGKYGRKEASAAER